MVVVASSEEWVGQGIPKGSLLLPGEAKHSGSIRGWLLCCDGHKLVALSLTDRRKSVFFLWITLSILNAKGSEASHVNMWCV